MKESSTSSSFHRHLVFLPPPLPPPFLESHVRQALVSHSPQSDACTPSSRLPCSSPLFAPTSSSALLPTLASRTGLADALIGLALLSVFALPVVYLAPSILDTLRSAVTALFKSILYLTLSAVVLVFVFAVLLLSEKAVKRWKGEGPATTSDAIGSAAADDVDGLRRLERVNRASKMDAAAEKVIDKLEETSVGKLLRRKVKGSAGKAGGKGKGGPEEVELKEFRGQAATTGVRRTPPPLPAR
ncbi:hypothetical protein JCM10207_006586 [Rhodosporidiobolus poonsookiae]